MKNSILFLVFLFGAFSINAQDTENFDALVDKLSTFNCDRGSAKECKAKAKQLLEDYIVKNEKEIQVIRTNKGIADTKPVSKETAMKVAKLYKEAHDLAHPDKAQPISRGAGPSPEAWANYYEWYRQQPHLRDLLPGFCIVMHVYTYQNETGCYYVDRETGQLNPGCMSVVDEYKVEAITNITEF